jgi:tetraacyldisaccharide 4'-kinase
MIIGTRSLLYKKNIFTKTKVAVPVIVVGNISLGGTGKTPLVIALVEWLRAQGFKPGVISRGYGGKADYYPCAVTENTSPHNVGDEPLLIYLRTQCPVVVDPKRVRGAQYLLAQYACDVVISDDGLQHYALARDIEIAVIDGVRRFGNGFCLPAGPLREPITRLKTVDFIVSNGLAKAGEISLQIKADLFHNLATQQVVTANHFASKKIHAIAGIGHPERFFALLRAWGLIVIEHPFPDHYAFKAGDLVFTDDYPILITEKDAVKCRSFATDNMWYVPVSAELPEGFLTELLRSIGLRC